MEEYPATSQPVPTKDYESLYFKMLTIINGCTSLDHLKDLGDNLVKIFRQKYERKKFKDMPKKKDFERMLYDLMDAIQKKKNAIRFQKHHERKNNP